MGSIHERLKRRQQAIRLLDQQGPTAVGDRNRQFAAKLRKLGTADRLVKLHDDLKRARGMSDMARHDEMYRLAKEAKDLGLKGRYGLLCNRTQCLSDGATWYNRGSYAFYCEDCAHMLNDCNSRDAERLLGAGEKLCIEVASAEEAAKLHVTP